MLTEEATPRFAPVYTDGRGNRVVILNANFLRSDPADLWEVRTKEFTMMCGIGLVMTQDWIDVNAETPHFRTKVWMYDVALISGPDFDKFCEEDGV